MTKNLLNLGLVLVIYGSSWCGWCTAQLEVLDANNIKYEYHDSSELPGNQMIPFMVNDYGVTHHGYLDIKDLNEFLKREI